MPVKVSLRSKKISKERVSYYLDFYPAIPHPQTGKTTRREFLGLYAPEKPKSFADKDEAKQIKALAENIKASRQINIAKEDYGFMKKKTSALNSFIDYFDGLTEHKKQTKSQSLWSNWKSVGNKIRSFAKDKDILMSDVDYALCEAFKNYLLSINIKHNTASSYYIKFCEAVKEAVLDGHIEKNPLDRIKVIPQKETHREFLSLEELRTLKDIACEVPELKIAMLFTALTGLRYSDSHSLKWDNIHYNDEMGDFIRITQKKGEQVNTIPISSQAREILGERGAQNEELFKKLPPKLSDWHNTKILNWIRQAGIDKHITYHNFRHTFATLQITMDTNIYTLSKLMGHKNIKTTQIYLNIVDEKKREAMNKIKL